MKLTIIKLPVQNMNSKIAIRQISKRFLFRHVQYSWYKIKQKEDFRIFVKKKFPDLSD